MELEGEILGFVIIFIAITVGFYFFVMNGNGNGQDNGDAVPDTPPVEPPPSDDGSDDGGDDNVPPEENETESVDNFSMAEEIHWMHMPLTYLIVNRSLCEGLPLQKMEEAFEIINEDTDDVVSFVETFEETDERDITILCVDPEYLIDRIENESVCEDFEFDHYKSYFDPLRDEVVDESDYVVEYRLESKNVTVTVYEVCYVEGDGAAGPDLKMLREEMPNIEENAIVNATLKLYMPGRGINSCADFPTREAHQILHALGFAHGDEPPFDDYYGWSQVDMTPYFQNIMFRDISCVNQRDIDSDYFSCLKRIYFDASAGDCSEVNLL
ncbi:MAG: hypothetical protein ABIH92_02320 [Nanoarchaeota archaeon]